jgi:LPS-assembly lipoprotein
LSKIVSALTLIVAAGVLAGCGFHLQAALTTPAEMERTYVAAVDRHSQFYRELRAQLGTAGVSLVDSEADATATFSIFFDDTAQRVLSVSARNVPTEYEVYYTIRYNLSSGPKNLLDSQTLTLTRDYTYDSTLVLGKAREEELLREAIVKDLVRIVLKQISIL